MATTGLHAHGARKGWRWTTDEITDGIAATEEDLAALGTEPVVSYLLGHDVGPGSGARELVDVVGEITRYEKGDLRWAGKAPQGCVLPGEGHCPVAPFDRMRTALRALTVETASAPGAAGPRPEERAPTQRWWRPRG
jgi:hypothetical protein